MKKRTHSRTTELCVDASPGGTSRRRLLRVLGGSGGAALGSVLVVRWHKPLVHAVVLPAHAQMSPAECPDQLAALSFWYETEPDVALSGHDSVRLQLTLSNATASNMSFSATASDTFQLWSVPSVIDPPVTINSAPSGIVPPGDTFSYDLEVDVSALPASETRLAFRPVDNDLFGTMAPSTAPLESAAFDCG